MNPTRQQQQLLEAIEPPGAKVSVRAGHGVGKTTALAIAIWWHLECFDYCRIPCTAPTASQLRLVLWSELSKVQRRADDQAKKLGFDPAFYLSNLFTKNQDLIFDPNAQNEWNAIARTARRDQPDALQGFHATDLEIDENDQAVQRSETGGALMFVIEEASGVPDEIFEVAEGALSSSGSRLIMVGNPVRNTGFFAASHQKDRSAYTALHFRCADSPLTDPSYRPKLVKKYGEGSNVVRVRADGEFPKQDDDVLIPLEQTELALTRPASPSTGAKRILGVDVARFGDDRTTFVVREGNRVLYIEVCAKQDTMQTTGKAVHLARLWQAGAIHVDVIGIGSGVVDRLTEMKAEVQATVVGVNVADSASMTPTSRNKRANRAPEDKFGTQDMVPRIMRDYLWLEMARWFAEDEPVIWTPDDEWKEHAEDLAAECASVRYGFDSSGKITVESKDKMKERGLRSPDLADALALTFSPNRLSVWERLAG